MFYRHTDTSGTYITSNFILTVPPPIVIVPIIQGTVHFLKVFCLYSLTAQFYTVLISFYTVLQTFFLRTRRVANISCK